MPVRECAVCEGSGLHSGLLAPRAAGCGFCRSCGVYVGFLCSEPVAGEGGAPRCPRCRGRLRSDFPWSLALAVGVAMAVLATSMGAVAAAEANRSAMMSSAPVAGLDGLPGEGALVKVTGVLAAGRSPAAFLRTESNGPVAGRVWVVFGFTLQEGERSVPVDVSDLHRSVWGKVVRSDRPDGSYRPGDQVAVAAIVMVTSVGKALLAQRLAPDLESLVVCDPGPATAALLSGGAAAVALAAALAVRRSRLASHARSAGRFREDVWDSVAARRRIRRRPASHRTTRPAP